MTKVRHHYIPRFYLRGFTDLEKGNTVWVFDKDEENVFDATPANIACEKHYHTFLLEDGEKDTETVENLYGIIETDTSAVIRKIHEGETLKQEDIAKFCTFASSMMIRVPNHRNNIEKAIADVMLKSQIMLAKNKDAFEESYNRFIEKTGSDSDLTAEDIRQFVLKGEYTVKANPQVSLYFSIKSIEYIAEVFHKMNWMFVKSNDDHKFLTCDNPLFYFDPTHDHNSFYGVGLMNKHIEVTLPLSQEICAYGSWGNPGQYNIVNGTSPIIKNINRRTVLAAKRFVFSSRYSDTLFKFAIKYKNSAPTLRVN
ncbi:MAG: DUF4238 domain-containing protein [Proteobacteria bacterium]|nr:DUF4238 domain-containing protein [Pseudomonadota bacterium]